MLALANASAYHNNPRTHPMLTTLVIAGVWVASVVVVALEFRGGEEPKDVMPQEEAE